MSKHTPGPWTAVIGADVSPMFSNLISFISLSPPIAVVAETRTAGQWEANARLIAAAPDLLAELRDLVCRIDRGEIHIDTEQARAAIAAAEGGGDA